MLAIQKVPYELVEAVPCADQIKVGDSVKVGVIARPYHPLPSEHFWAQIVMIDSGWFIIVITQELIHTDLHGLKKGDELSVQRENITEALDGDGNPAPPCIEEPNHDIQF